MQPEQSDLEMGALADWNAIIRSVLVYAYGSRRAGILEVIFPLPSTLSSLGIETIVKVSSRGMLFGFVRSCSPDLLGKVAASSAFDCGDLWVTSIGDYDQERVSRLIDSVDPSYLQLPETSEEILAKVADGRMVLWLNPGRAYNSIIRHLQVIARSLGWDLCTTR